MARIERHFSVRVDRRGEHPIVKVGDRAAGIPVATLTIRRFRDVFALGRLLVYGPPNRPD